MRAPVPPPAAELVSLYEHERELPSVPPAVRARVVARLHAAQLAGLKPTPLVSAPPVRRRWAIAAGLLCLVSTAATAAVLEFRGHRAKAPDKMPVATAAETTRPLLPRRASMAARAPLAPEPALAVPGLPAGNAQPRHPAAADAVRDELRLLKQARAAVSQQEYAAALRFVAEHTRRFKNGRLAEEREALRVSSLAGLGRTDEAQRAAAAFQVRFPRSVLLEAVSQMPASKP